MMNSHRPPVLMNNNRYLKGLAPQVNLSELRRLYGEVRAYNLLLQAMYFVKIENIFNHKGDIPWFKDSKLCYLATDAPLSLGSNESESFYAGNYQANYLTQRSSSEVSVTFMETVNADISRSYIACRELAFNKDGTVNEPKKYAFKLTVGFLNPKNAGKSPLQRSWLVGVSSGNVELSSSGRSEVAKPSIDFVKLRPLLFE